MRLSQLFVVMAVGMAAMLGTTVWAGEAKREVKIKLTDAPQAVRDTLTRVANGGQITEVEQVTQDGTTTYEADVVIGGKKYEVSVRATGELIRQALDEDKDDENGDDDDDDDDDDENEDDD